MAGLFDFGADDDERRQNIGLLALLAGGNMLAANGPGVTTGQAIGHGIASGAQGMQQMQVNQLRRQQLAQQAQLHQAQISAMQAKADQEQAKRDALTRMFPAGSPMADAALLDPNSAIRAQFGFDKPASQREWDHFNTLTPDQKVEYLNMKRAQTWRDLGATQVAPNPVNPASPPVATLTNTLKPGEQPAIRGEQAAATETGKAAGQAQARIPGAELQAQQMLSVVDGITSHPALGNVVGMPGNLSGFTARIIGTGLPASPESDFMSRVDQLKGQQFLQAYETLKGGGQITEVEGRKAEAAMARMQNLNLDKKDYMNAADELRSVIAGALEKTRKSAAGAGGQPQNTQRAGPAIGAVVDGWEYIGGDPNNRMSWRKK